MLSMAGRVTLSQSVISAIPSYVMQGCVLPVRFLNHIDKINRDFLWGESDSGKKMHMVSWSKITKITKPKEKVGLGIQGTKGRNLTLAAKLYWRMTRCKGAGWAEVLHKKYQCQRQT